MLAAWGGLPRLILKRQQSVGHVLIRRGPQEEQLPLPCRDCLQGEVDEHKQRNAHLFFFSVAGWKVGSGFYPETKVFFNISFLPAEYILDSVGSI